MATYKVIQDIEAEDKFLGPLTIKQFVFGMVGLFFGYLNVFSITRGFPYAVLIFAPPMILAFFLAVPWSKDQPTEVWVLAKLRFYFKTRRRIWDQTGMEELVTITAPKKEEKPLTDNLSKKEVKSRLQILAETIDSRGWAIKDAQMSDLVHPTDTPDRLVSATTLPQEVPDVDLSSIPDVYDLQESSVGNFDRMIQQSEEVRKVHNLQTMEQARREVQDPTNVRASQQFTPPPTDYQTYVAQTSQPPAKPISQPVYEPPTVDERELTEKLKNLKGPDYATSHMRTIQPIDPYAPAAPPAQVKTDNNDYSNPVPPPPNPAILDLANNNDLDVATIARQAKKETDSQPNEVVISLR